MNRSFCNRILEALHACGVEDLVVSPGSRSTPLLLAALQSPLRLHSIIDERSAAFFALGRARAEGKKVALLCTSGSAGAHYLPALLEARYAGHVLIAITADRPGDMQDSGANQTIAQAALFAAACPPALLLHAGDDDDLASRRRVQQAVQLAAGPVHINLAFRKPLEPLAEEDSVFGSPPAPQLLFPASQTMDDAALAHVVRRCGEAERGVIVAGPCAADLGASFLALAEATGFVLLAESTSGARLSGGAHSLRCDGFAHVLAQPQLAEALRPDLVLQIGGEPSCAALLRWLEGLEDACILRLPGNTAANRPDGGCHVILGDLASGLAQLSTRLSLGKGSSYAQAWQREDERAWTAATRHIEAHDRGDTLGEVEATAQVLASLASGAQLTVGNSQVVRNLDLALPGAAASLRILHQRGTSGIDGLIAGAIGASGSGTSALLIGDVSAVHDLSSLSLAPLARGPLQIIVLDNVGGRIFSSLPIGKQDLTSEEFQFWLTTPKIDFQAICGGYHIPYLQARTPAELAAGLSWSLEQGGVSLLHLRVTPDSTASFMKRMREALA